MGDLIDRQAALKELAVYIHLIDKTMGKGLLTDDDCMEAAKSVLGENELPAVQPGHIADSDKKVSNSCAHENDVIFRQAAIDAVEKSMYENPHENEIHRGMHDHEHRHFLTILMGLPSAQPEIIRCKDCEHRDKYGCCKYWKGLAMGDIPIATDDYDFCSYAKRI